MSEESSQERFLEQLSGIDASFLNLETARSPLHISGLAVYDQSTAPEHLVRFKAILENDRELRALPKILIDEI